MQVKRLFHLSRLDVSQGAAKWCQGKRVAGKETHQVSRIVPELKILESWFTHFLTTVESMNFMKATRVSLQATEQESMVEAWLTSILLLTDQTASEISTYNPKYQLWGWFFITLHTNK